MKPSALLAHTSHRPFDLPAGPWLIQQSWVNVLFAHYALPADVVRTRVPSALELDTFDGTSYVSVVAFRIDPFRTRGVPLALRFPELNLRTYVRAGGRAGVYFFSLDAASQAAVHGARALFRLNYYYAAIHMSGHGRTEFTSKRLDRPRADFHASYRTAGDSLAIPAGSLEHWLVERYCLFAVRSGPTFRVDIHHVPWVLQPAVATVQADHLFAAAGLPAPTAAPLLHAAARQDVLTWGPEAIS